MVAKNLKVKEVHLPEALDRHIVCLSPLGADEDRRNRDGILQHLEEQLSGGSVGSLLRGAAWRYVRMQGRVVTLDREKITQDVRYEGKWSCGRTRTLP